MFIFNDLKRASQTCLLLCACTVLLLLLLAACGKRRPPTPPRAINRITILTARQQGANVLLEFALPATAKQEIKQINLYRLNEQPAAPDFLAVEDFAQRSTQIAALTNLPANGAAVYADALSNYTQPLKLRYSAVLVYGDNRRSNFSNFAIVTPFFNVAAAPVNLAAAVTQQAVRLDWQKPVVNLDRTPATNLIGYNLYRTEKQPEANAASAANAANSSAQNSTVAAAPRLLNQTPLGDASFEDRTFEFGKSYEYFVRSVSLAENNTPVESQDSNRVSIKPQDVFAPAAPIGLTVAAAPNRLSLFFAANQEPDIAGYVVFRATNENEPLDKWLRLNQDLIATTTFQDLTVESGQKYFYYVRAVDNAGNQSEPSETVSEVAP